MMLMQIDFCNAMCVDAMCLETDEESCLEINHMVGIQTIKTEVDLA